MCTGLPDGQNAEEGAYRHAKGRMHERQRLRRSHRTPRTSPPKTPRAVGRVAIDLASTLPYAG